MMAESVLSCVTGELTDSIVARLNSEEEPQLPTASSLALSSTTVSDLATIVEAVALGETSEEEGVTQQLASTVLQEKSVTSATKSAPVPIAKPVNLYSTFKFRVENICKIYIFLYQAEASSTMEGSLDRCSYDDTEFLNSVKNGKNAVLSAAGQKSSSASAGRLF